jgi:hypothetical protein
VWLHKMRAAVDGGRPMPRVAPRLVNN